MQGFFNWKDFLIYFPVNTGTSKAIFRVIFSAVTPQRKALFGKLLECAELYQEDLPVSQVFSGCCWCIRVHAEDVPVFAASSVLSPRKSAINDVKSCVKGNLWKLRGKFITISSHSSIVTWDSVEVESVCMWEVGVGLLILIATDITRRLCRWEFMECVSRHYLLYDCILATSSRFFAQP